MPLRESKTFYQPVVFTVIWNRDHEEETLEELPSMSIFDNIGDALVAAYAMVHNKEAWLINKIMMHDGDNAQLEWLDHKGWTELPEFRYVLRKLECNMRVSDQDARYFPPDTTLAGDKIPV
tara:strand:+ start:994 stop:1356 length:363 start_codon:yes stop_codon:yes gene_type:complete